MAKKALTAKQEAFAQAVASGMTQSDAYRSAYSAGKMKATSINVNASKLMADTNIAQRVVSLRAPVIAKMQYGLQEAMLEAEDAFKVSKMKENGGAMVAAVTLRAKLQGLLIERKEVRTGPLDDMPADELEAMDAAIEAIRTASRPVAGRARSNAD